MRINDLKKGGHLPSLVAAVVHFDVSFMMWVLVGALGAYIAKDLDLTSTQKGLMVAVPPLGGSAFRLILGPLADRMGIKRLGLTTMAMTSVPLLWGWLAGGSYAQVLGIGAMLGIAGASFAIALPLASRWYPPELQGLALGIAGAGNSGTVISALLAPRIAERIGWHGAFGVALLPVALAWIAFALLAKEPPRRLGAVTPKGSIFTLLRDPDPRTLCRFYAVSFGGFVGLAGYLSMYFVDAFGLSKVAAGTSAAICTVAGSLLRPVGGGLADRHGSARVAQVVLGLAGVLALGLATGPAQFSTTVLLFVLLGCLGMGNGAIFQAVGVRVPERVGAMTGLVGAAGGIGGFLLPFAFGWLRGTFDSFAPGFLLFGLVLLATAGAAGIRHRHWVPLDASLASLPAGDGGRGGVNVLISPREASRFETLGLVPVELEAAVGLEAPLEQSVPSTTMSGAGRP